MTEKVYSYFPGCSLATSAKENNATLIRVCRQLGATLVELEDWSCCGSSSAHSINAELAEKLAMRNLSLASPLRPLLVACPSCYLRLRQAQLKIQTDEDARQRYVRWFGDPGDQLEIIHFFELLDQVDWQSANHKAASGLKGLKFAPYYGCMLARPPAMRREKKHVGLMERILTGLGAEPVVWGYASRCCGTFLSVVRPEIVTPMVREIMNDARWVGAECLVTACAMCHLNLEVRSDPDASLPVFHFSEILALAFGEADMSAFFERHLIDPRPLLRAKHLLV
jgi:heterodisulfide reductase subunit B